MSIGGEDVFPFVHNTIATVLTAPSAIESRSHSSPRPRLWFVLDDSGKISEIRSNLQKQDAVTVDDLVALAVQANELIYTNQSSMSLNKHAAVLDPWLDDIRLLTKPSGSPRNASCFVMCLLVTLNCLESSIRSSLGSAAVGKAPLLKDMLEAMNNDEATAKVCKVLLLPSGLNLRNLVWHGFIQEDDVLQHWLALILALLQIFRCLPVQLEVLQGPLLLRNVIHASRRCRGQLDNVLKEGSRIRKSMISEGPFQDKTIPIVSSGFIPEQHLPLFHFALDLIRKGCPSLASILLVVVLEHCLRILWCKANNRPHNVVATKGSYYVTLDGHGQRNKHDVILHYDCDSASTDATERNNICDVLGSSTMSLLTDLFISGSGGPNLRAALAHGVTDGLCLSELRHLVTTVTSDGGQMPMHTPMFDTVDVLLLLFDLISSTQQQEITNKRIHYIPLFSFAATTADSIEDLLVAATALNELSKNYTTDTFLPEVNLDDIRLRYDRLINTNAYRSNTVWSVDDLFEERIINARLLPLAAARTLLFDTLLAAQTFLGDEKCINLDKPRMKAKAFHMSRLVCFAMYVALCHMECPDSVDGKKLVERTRMVVSTVVTFIFKNDQRSYRALETFANGKHTKALIATISLE